MSTELHESGNTTYEDVWGGPKGLRSICVRKEGLSQINNQALVKKPEKEKQSKRNASDKKDIKGVEDECLNTEGEKL